MPFQYKTVIVIGATSGIGAGLADKLVAEGSHVIAVGRRQARLDAFVAKHGAEKASGVRFDITDAAGLDAFVNGILAAHPTLDAVLLNSGIQSPILLSRPAEVDLAAFHHEVHVNFTCIVNLALKFLPHLQKKTAEDDTPTALIFTGTILALVPAVLLPAYSVSKTALSVFVECLRAQNKQKGTEIIEFWPPIVQTELHDYLGEQQGRAMGMPLDVFVEQTYAGLAAGKEQFIIGTLGPPGTIKREDIDEVVEKRAKIRDTLTGIMMAQHKDRL